tara:strand:+ start:657 stop:878 length:222 start_codon:yes stop_codon:yes gene_type:complete
VVIWWVDILKKGSIFGICCLPLLRDGTILLSRQSAYLGNHGVKKWSCFLNRERMKWEKFNERFPYKGAKRIRK